MRESRTSGSVEGVASDGHPYSDLSPTPIKEGQCRLASAHGSGTTQSPPNSVKAGWERCESSPFLVETLRGS